MLEGQGIGFWKTSRVKKLCEDENYRNFIVSRLNTSLDKKVAEDEQHLEDVVCIKFTHKIYGAIILVIQKVLLSNKC